MSETQGPPDKRLENVPGRSLLKAIELIGTEEERFEQGKMSEFFDTDFLNHLATIHVSNEWAKVFEHKQFIDACKEDFLLLPIFEQANKETGGIYDHGEFASPLGRRSALELVSDCFLKDKVVRPGVFTLFDPPETLVTATEFMRAIADKMGGIRGLFDVGKNSMLGQIWDPDTADGTDRTTQANRASFLESIYPRFEGRLEDIFSRVKISKRWAAQAGRFKVPTAEDIIQLDASLPIGSPAVRVDPAAAIFIGFRERVVEMMTIISRDILYSFYTQENLPQGVDTPLMEDDVDEIIYWLQTLFAEAYPEFILVHPQ